MAFSPGAPATTVGIVKDAQGKIKRIINPTYANELTLHKLAAGETMTQVTKANYGIGLMQNARPDQVEQIIADHDGK